MRVSAATQCIRLFSSSAGATQALNGQLPAVGVVGGGLMGSGIATSLISSGYNVRIREVSEAAAKQAIGKVDANLSRRVKTGKLSQQDFEAAMARLTVGVDLRDMADRDLVIESIIESMPMKQTVFDLLNKVVKPSCILATNTSTMNILEIAAKVPDRSRVIGMHYFSPAHVMPLLEIVKTSETSHATIAAAQQLGKASGKHPIVVGNCVGFAVNRMWAFYMQAANLLVDCGVSPYAIDAALTKFGMPMGPFRMSDMAGVDVVRNADIVIQAAYPYCYNSSLSTYLVSAHRLGEKSGSGYYKIGPDRTARPDADELDALVAASRTEAAVENERIGHIQDMRRTFSQQEIVEMTLLPVVNEGMRILEEGFASSVADLDVASCMGYGFPAAKKGVMHWVKTEVGVQAAKDKLTKWNKAFSVPLYSPCASFDKLKEV